jgi:hypothetical protein
MKSAVKPEDLEWDAPLEILDETSVKTWWLVRCIRPANIADPTVRNLKIGLMRMMVNGLLQAYPTLNVSSGCGEWVPKKQNVIPEYKGKWT